MNKILMTAANSTLGGGSYESPEVNVVEVHSEGVLCMSGTGSFNDLDEGDDIIW